MADVMGNILAIVAAVGLGGAILWAAWEMYFTLERAVKVGREHCVTVTGENLSHLIDDLANKGPSINLKIGTIGTNYFMVWLTDGQVKSLENKDTANSTLLKYGNVH